MLWPPIRYSHEPINYELTVPAPAPPSAENWLGTDDQGRDVLARLLYGFRLSVLFGLILTVTSSLIGIVVGAVQGYYGGWLDLGGQRFVEIWSSMPILYLIIVISSFVVPGFWTLLLIMLLLVVLPGWVGWLLQVVGLWWVIGARSLADHGRAGAAPLRAQNLPLAREQVAWIVSRDTQALDANGVARAATESMLENGADAIFASLFWFVLGLFWGVPGCSVIC